MQLRFRQNWMATGSNRGPCFQLAENESEPSNTNPAPFALQFLSFFRYDERQNHRPLELILFHRNDRARIGRAYQGLRGGNLREGDVLPWLVDRDQVQAPANLAADFSRSALTRQSPVGTRSECHRSADQR